MVVGSLRVRLLCRESRTLKDKRQVVRSILDKVRHQFNVSAAEVGELDHRQLVVLGFSTVGAEREPVRSCLEAIVNALRAHPVAEFVDHEMEVLTVD
jgi:uncharacterized protein